MTTLVQWAYEALLERMNNYPGSRDVYPDIVRVRIHWVYETPGGMRAVVKYTAAVRSVVLDDFPEVFTHRGTADIGVPPDMTATAVMWKRNPVCKF